MNPFWILREIYDEIGRQSALPAINRTVSLKYLNPKNMPDEWEKKGILSFERGEGEMSEITDINGKPYMRVLKPLKIEESCLRCHAFQGYKVGDIRGGMSIAVPMKPYYDSEIKTFMTITISHILLWLVGIGSIVILSRSIYRQHQTIAESEWKFRTLSESAGDWVYWVNESREIVFMAPSYERITGYTQKDFMENRNLVYEIIHPEDKVSFEKHISNFKSPQHDEMEFRIITKDGQEKWLSHVCVPIYVEDKFFGRRVSNRDITDKKRLQEQLTQSQKMESLDLLAGGIAHDFNNLLTAIIGYASLLQEELRDSNETVRKDIQQVLTASEKAQKLTSSLLAFSRKQIMRHSTVSLHKIIEGISEILKRVIGEDIELKADYSEIEFPIFADAHQIEQVILNLATNAKDVMPSGGKLTIETTTMTLDSDFTDKYNAKPGRYMILSISDTGKGIDKKHFPHIFEPFFTTKEKGKGTGLSLSMVYGVIKQHEGFINVYSEKGVGTIFNIYLPVSSEEYKDTGIAEALPYKLQDDLRGSGTILVAEDEETVRGFLKTTIENYGYKVITAVDGEDAISKYNENKGHINMVIMDVIMPRKNGKEAYDIIKKINPDIKALFMSGYTQDIITSKGISEEGLEFIEKPLRIQTLMEKIKNMIK
jgi:PAS domain S-box-containing protein